MAEQRVVNTSPLIYLSRANLLELLHLNVERVIVPQAVLNEILAWPTADEAQKAVKSSAWLEVAVEEVISGDVIAWDLGKGESAVLAYRLSHPGYTLVVDDLAARRCAAALGMAVRGTLGLVLRAKKAGALPSARAAIKELRIAGMYLSESVCDQALFEVGE